MTKAKSQAVACSLEPNKKGLHHRHHHNSNNQNATDVVFDPSCMPLDDDPNSADALSPATANLSLKKATPPQPAKKLVIKLVKAKPTLPANFEDETWAKLKSAINAIFFKQPNSCDMEKLYQAVITLCLHRLGGRLYQRIEKECEELMSVALRSLVGQSPDLVVFLSLVEKCWLGEAIDRTLLNHLLKMFTALGIYSGSFEKPFLEHTSEFYAAEGTKYIQQYDVPDYLKHVETRLHEEHERCVLYLDAVTRKPLIATGFMMLMEGHRIEDLRRMYSLFSRIMVIDEEKDKDMVPFLLEFKASLDSIWEECFSKNETLCIHIRDAFEYLINLCQNRPAELVAKFLDEKLHTGNKGTSKEELECTLDKVLVLFRDTFLMVNKGKDVFEAFYRKDLAKRLLLGKSASIDAEKSMISKDIELSKEINESFKQSSQARTKLPSGIEMSVHVLTTGYWPTYPPTVLRLPCELNVYQEFYLSKYSGRHLMWQNSLGHCVLKAGFLKVFSFCCRLPSKTVVLMLFNDAEKLSFLDIKGSTSIEDKELRRTLQSLACGKFPKGRDVENDDSFVFNDGFSSPLFRIKVDAAIVRIMKTRKVLSHTLLITELIQQFPRKPTDLKKRIESLIDREYLEQGKNNPQIYNYLA
ncbi:Cullin-4 [Hibiscus syriacus]|uniref:Cullin-4 n=1 Tax=Hibiscus syriacus TaxID=106335 RepID=A0A6A3B8C4_HIBSY|nr:Cullin-4 [Hibiscus syriacus]